jgi:hypothetical protein
MSMSPDMAARVAGELELGGGLPCGGCGRPHATSAAGWRDSGDWCSCPCCVRYLHEWTEQIFREDYPDLIDRRGVITEAAVEEAIRREERELAEHEASWPMGSHNDPAALGVKRET